MKRLHIYLTLVVAIVMFLVSCAPKTPEIAIPEPQTFAGNLFEFEQEITEQKEHENLQLKLLGEYGDVEVYKVQGDGILISEPVKFSGKDQESLERKIAQYKKIIQANKDINFHAFYLELIEYSSFHPLNDEIKNVDAGRSLAYFEENKPNRLKLDALRLTSFADHTRYYYRTDHHWNAYGVLEGYKKIHQLLSQSYPEISPLITTGQVHTFPDIHFLGRWAMLMNYHSKTEKFTVPLVNLPPYRIYDREGNEIDYNDKDEYLAGEYSKERYADHYVSYYGADVDFLEYVSENGSDRNLLIIGDSFTNAIEPLLAAHYHHTYAVDIRKYPDYHFSFSEFIAQYDVDDVLILGGGSVVLYEWRWSIQP